MKKMMAVLAVFALLLIASCGGTPDNYTLGNYLDITQAIESDWGKVYRDIQKKPIAQEVNVRQHPPTIKQYFIPELLNIQERIMQVPASHEKLLEVHSGMIQACKTQIEAFQLLASVPSLSSSIERNEAQRKAAQFLGMSSEYLQDWKRAWRQLQKSYEKNSKK